MKTALRALFTLLLSAALCAEAPEFRLDEPISLDLKDAKVTEVITLLGALAHLPVSIDPSIQGVDHDPASGRSVRDGASEGLRAPRFHVEDRGRQARRGAASPGRLRLRARRPQPSRSRTRRASP